MSLVRAEMLKLVRRRGLMIWCLILTVGAVIFAEAIVAILHAANPSRHGPAGGESNFEGYSFLLSGLGNAAAIILGATAGTQDVQNGVFRDLVVTGRKRSTLFNVRFLGALAVFLPMMAAGLVLAIGGSYLLAGDRPGPGGHDVADVVAYTLLLTVVDMVIAIGLSAFVSSRIVVGVLIAWNAIVSHILISLSVLGGARKLIDVAAAENFAPRHMIDNHIPMSNATALLVLAVWAAIFIRAGLWWTVRRDA